MRKVVIMDVGRKPFNILKSTQLGSVKQSQLNDIQKATFIEKQPAVINNWKEQIEIKNAQLATKTFGYGLPGPHSFDITSVNADSSQTILKPNNMNFPVIRNQFINSLKQLN